MESRSPRNADKRESVGAFSALEDELTLFSTAGFLGNGSPGRADALVWALTDLMNAPMNSYGIYEFYRRKAAELGVTSALGLRDNRTEERIRRDQIANSLTPLHPDNGRRGHRHQRVRCEIGIRARIG